jgi:PD-(D/E)XK nuclease superfamily
LPDGLVTRLLPVLGRSLDVGFNVFDVMHHGLHEKQISNVFRWLLESEGTHGLGDRFLRIFVDEVNRALPGRELLPHAEYWVRQEVNTAPVDVGADIADLVLESRAAVLVVENYFASDGHGHSYDRYLAYGQRDGRRGVVVLLCRDEDASLQTMGWENAAVLTYATLVDRLHEALADDDAYRRKHPEAHSFLDQMHRKFVKDRGRMHDSDVLGFVVAMCASGEARRYQEQRQDVAAERFASDLAAQARQRFGEGRELLQRAKGNLRSFSAGPLKRQLNATLGDGFVGLVSARFSGIYQWTVNFDIAEDGGVDFGEPPLQLKFGPSAWFANERDPHWQRKVDLAVVDYSYLFLTRAKNRELRQSAAALHEVLDGLEPTDRRLHDEIVRMLSDDT